MYEFDAFPLVGGENDLIALRENVNERLIRVDFLHRDRVSVVNRDGTDSLKIRGKKHFIA